jgi:hypothetical protein
MWKKRNGQLYFCKRLTEALLQKHDKSLRKTSRKMEISGSNVHVMLTFSWNQFMVRAVNGDDSERLMISLCGS